MTNAPRADAAPGLDWWDESSQLQGRDRQLMIWEIIAVFGVSLGASALRAVVSFIGSVTERQALSAQHTVLNGTQAPGRPWLDLTLQLVSIVTGLAPPFLVFYLLARNGERPSSIGVDATQPARDLGRGAAIAAVIGGCGLGFYYLAFKAGIALNIVAANLPDEEIPEVIDSPSTGLPAGRDKENPPSVAKTEPYKTHLAYVKERRSEEEAEQLLEDALNQLRARRGKPTSN